MSDTPETDAMEYFDAMCDPDRVVEAGFARKLERERDRLLKELNVLSYWRDISECDCHNPLPNGGCLSCDLDKIFNATTKQKTEFNLKIYQCPDGSWRILSEDYIDEWGDDKIRNLTAKQLVEEIKKIIIT